MDVSEAARPTGTVTFLFTDIQGSTTLWERHPEMMSHVVARHDVIVRTAIHNHDGYVFSTGGDGFAAAFPTPSDAVRAAVQAQRELQAETWPDSVDLHVRMGLHVGAAQERDGDYFGSAVNRTARVMSLAHGDQVVVSLALEELVRDDLRNEVAFVALGEHALRGMARSESLFQLTAPGLPHEFPPIASRRGNLPSPATSFVGRVHDVDMLAGSISSRRLVTLVGPGGVGKTRLAIETAVTVADRFPDGVWLVELAPVAEPEAVAHAVASSLAIPPEAGLTLVDSIVAGLAGRRLLIVLDNCEHVIDTAAAIAAAIERGAPHVTILASSREPLGVTGEWVYLVPPLEPAREAVDLFVERAVAANSAFVVRENERHALVDLCTRLDGIPLAVELAAGRMRSMSITELASRLQDRFRVLRANRRRDVADHRQLTLLGTVEWSYRLLEPDERLLFDRLSVFAGSFDLAAAEAVCPDDRLDELAVVDILDGLVGRSMVQALPTESGTRFRLLETLRHYGAERLEDSGEHHALASRHLDHYVDVAQHAGQLMQTDDFESGAAVFDKEWDNLRAALSWAVQTENSAAATALVVAPYWYAFVFEGYELGAFAEHVATRVVPASAMVLGIAALFAGQHDDLQRAQRLAQAGLAAVPFPTHADTVVCWQTLVTCEAHLAREGDRPAGDTKDALRHTYMSYAEAAGAVADAYTSASHYALAALFASNTDEGDHYVAEAKRLRAGGKNANLSVLIGVADGILKFAAGQRTEAAAVLREARHVAERAGPYPRAIVAWVIALRAAAPGFDVEPSAAYYDAIALLHDLREWANIWLTVESLATWWADMGRLEPAARVLGYLRSVGRGFLELERRRGRALAAIEAHPEHQAWLALGAATDRDQLIGYVLDELENDLRQRP